MKGKPATMSSSFLIWGSATAMLAALVVACTGGHSTEVPMSDVPVSASEVPATAVDSPVVGEGARYWVQSDPFVGMYDAGTVAYLSAMLTRWTFSLSCGTNLHHVHG